MKLFEEVVKVSDNLLAEYEKEAEMAINDPYKGVSDSIKKFLSGRAKMYVAIAKELETQLVSKDNFNELLFRVLYKQMDKELNDTIEDIKIKISKQEPSLISDLILTIKDGHKQFIKVFKQFEGEVK